MEKTPKKPKISKKELWRTIKFTLFSISAGVIQLLSFAIMYEWTNWLPWWPAYLISIILSVIWNFTFNRKFTFKSANNVPLAMTLVLVYYAVFTPASVFGGNALEAAWGEKFGILVTLLMMLINFVTEFLWDKFVVFRGTIDTNDLAKKEQAKADAQGEEQASVEVTEHAVATDDVSQKIEVNVVLTAVGENKIEVTKIIRRVTSLELPQVKKLVENLPVTIAEHKLKDEAIAIADELRSVGATVELK